MSILRNHYLIIVFVITLIEVMTTNQGKEDNLFSGSLQRMLCQGDDRQESDGVLLTTGVLDRIEDYDKAVILIEQLREELVIPMHELPAGSNIDTWFQISANHEAFKIIQIDCVKTRTEKVKSLLDGQWEKLSPHP